MGQPALKLTTNPEEFFRTQLHLASRSIKFDLDEHVEFYLVKVLCDFIDPARLNSKTADIDVLNTPVALMFKQALESPLTERLKILKGMGDTSLYVSGYFQDYFNRKSFDLNYYIQMGQTAYAHLAEISQERAQQETLAQTYEMLASQFGEFVEILAIVADGSASNTNHNNLLAIYDRWNQTGSERLRLVLKDHGIEAIPVSRKKQ